MGNRDQNAVAANTFNTPIIARYIRVHPLDWNLGPSLRMEFYGCRSGMEIFVLEL